MKNGAYLDSGIFIALMCRRDRWHTDAKSLFSSPPAAWVTSALVISETYGWFLHKMGEEEAREFLRLTRSLTKLQVLDTSNQHRLDTVRVLEKFRGSKLSFVDASSLAYIEKRKIGTVWSTDRHLGLSGTRVLPFG